MFSLEKKRFLNDLIVALQYPKRDCKKDGETFLEEHGVIGQGAMVLN